MVKALLIHKSRVAALIMFLFFLNIKSFALSNGDYVATTTGTWNNAANWMIWHGSFLTMTPAPDYPGQNTGMTYNVTIDGLFGITTMTIDASPAYPIASLTIGGLSSATCINYSTLTITGNLTGGSGTFTQGTNAYLNIGGTLSVSTFDATASGNTVNYTAASPSILATTYYNLSFSGSGSSSIPATAIINGDLSLTGAITVTNIADLAIGGNLLVADGNTFNAAGYNLSVNGTTTIGSGTSGVFATTSAAGTKTFRDLIRVNAGATWNNTLPCAINVKNGGITNNGIFNAVSVYTFDSTDQALHGTFGIPTVIVTGIHLTNYDTFTVTANLTGAGGDFVQAAPHALLNISCDSITIDSLHATANGNTVNYNGPNAQTVYSTNYYNLTLSSGTGAGTVTDTLQTGTGSIFGNFTLTGGSVATTGVTNMLIFGDVTLGSGTSFATGGFSHGIGGNFLDSGTFVADPASTITFNGFTGSQTIGGPSPITFANLTISNSGGGVTMVDANNQTKTVTGTLLLVNGKLTTSTSNVLLLTSTAVANVTNTASCVLGPVQKVGSTAFDFPVGGPNGYAPIGIGATGNSAQIFQAEYFRASAYNLGPIATGSNLKRISACDYWTLDPINNVGAVTADVTLYWSANNPCGGQYVTDLPTLAIGHFGGTNWDEIATPASYTTTGSAASGSILYANNTNFSPFTLASTSITTNPLPIIFDYFNATKMNGYNQLLWKAECTASSNQFEVQRSYTGNDFTSIDTVVLSSATDCENPFSYNDYGTSGHHEVYYRIKATDITGSLKYSDTKLISDNNVAADMISVVPNPVVNDAVVRISSTKNDKLELVVMGIDGKVLFSNSVQTMIGDNTFHLPAGNLVKGVYIIKGISSNGNVHLSKFIKQ
ncbi:MAG TPA: T9SS type A sorting domain-containing protein [Puia sp.]|nr:T9SS type A sorting domain-containing protein [Puia sp.]